MTSSARGTPRSAASSAKCSNLAARLQGRLPEPNTVVICPTARRRLLGDLFESEGIWVKGHPAPALPGGRGPGRLCGRVPVESRFEALHAISLTALEGGKKNSNCSFDAGPGQRRGQGQVVLILSDEAGIGKSGSWQRCWNASPPSRTPAYAISARLSTLIACSSDNRPVGACCRAGARRHTASEARQVRQDARAILNLTAGYGTPC